MPIKNKLLYAIAGTCFVACHTPVKKQKEAPAILPSAPASPPLSDKEYKHYNSCVAHFFDSLLIKHGGFNGSILVAKNGNIVYEKYCGYIDPVQKTDTLTPRSAFHLASVSKTFTAMGVLKLWELGKLNLEDPLSNYFSNFPYPGITIKMLLSHRSGLPNYTHYLEIYKWDKRKMVTNADVLQSLYTMHPPLDFPSGKHFAYCNTNFALLALIIEKVSGESYPDFMKNTFFIPLGMKDTYVFTLADTLKAMPSFEWNNRKFDREFLDEVYGDKNIYSTVRDLLKWDQALYAGALFKQQTLDAAFTPYSFEKAGKRNYGLGWRMTLLENGKKLLYHNGWWHGNNTVFIRLIDEHTTILVLGNKFNRKIYFTKYICDLFGNYMQHHTDDEDT